MITEGAMAMRPANLKDDSLIALYESVRRQTLTDQAAALRSRVIGYNIKAYAEKLGAEMERRQLKFTPIDWRDPDRS
jgi:hypothetical protein